VCDPRLIRSAPVGAVLKDDKVAGLQLHVKKTGRFWFLYHRNKLGDQRRPKLGEYPTMSPESARRVARELLERVAMGEDPSKDRQEARGEMVLNELWVKWREDRGLKKKSAWMDRMVYEKHIHPRMAKLRLSEIRYANVRQMHTEMAGSPVVANRAVALLSTIFNYAIGPLELDLKNPTKGVVRYKENHRRRYANREEVARITAALKEKEADYPESVLFIYLLIFTGARKSEIANALWENYNGVSIHVADSKTGRRTIQIPPQAASLLGNLPRKGRKILPLSDPKKLWGSVRKAAGCPDLRLHDLRHSFASFALSSGVTLSQVGELLGHASTQTTKRYAHLVEEAAQSAAAQTATVISQMMAPVSASSKWPRNSTVSSSQTLTSSGISIRPSRQVNTAKPERWLPCRPCW